MYTLGIDTSNYATSLAVFCTETKEVVCDKKQFLPVKENTLGLRQSEAVFHHTQALPVLMQQLDAEFPLCRVDAVGVSVKPRPQEGSYMPCFTVGYAAAQSFALARHIPCRQTTHQQGHIAAAVYSCGAVNLWESPFLLFHVSGGTTELLLCQKGQVLQTVGKSTDLYAGQAVDRIGVKLGFAFPAGVEVSRLAAQCKETIRPVVSVKGTDCSLSGLENRCNDLLKKGAAPEYAAKYCLEYIAYTAAAMIKNARQQYPSVPAVCAGGVMSSDIIRATVQKKLPEVYFAPPKFSSDNAIGVAILAADEVRL